MTTAGGPSANLLVVCGMQRTGTSFMGALLNKSAAVEVCNEVPDIFEFSPLADLVDQYKRRSREIAGEQVWKKITEASIEEGTKRIVDAFCRALKPVVGEGSDRWDAGRKDDASLVCIKRPGAELQVRRYEQLFDYRKPFYIYCIRNPLHVYESILSMPWGKDLKPRTFLNRTEKSIEAVEHMLASDENRVSIFNIEEVSLEVNLRIAKVERIFDALGLPVCTDVKQFVVDGTPVNRAVDKFSGQAFVEHGEKDRRLAEMERAYARNRELVERLERILALAKP